MSDPLGLRLPATAAVAHLPVAPPDLPTTRLGLLRSMRGTAAWLARRQWKIRTHGLQHLPVSGPAILAANHLGVLDGPLLVAMAPRPTFALAKSELFEGQVGRLLEAAGQIPIQQRAIDTRALRRAVKILDEGHLLGIFPEGSRDIGDMARIRGGAVYLAMLTGAPIVPVALLGTREPGQTVKDVPRRGATIHIVYGEPIAIDRTPWPRRQQVVAARTEDVRRRLAAHVARAVVLTGMALPGVPAPKIAAAA
ncbi:MAG: lysophospholipid acyltransferase family protein [Propionibacteriaceae bacterium]|nr:lysophospholipid acyltransferase family protein [Propionibacteriaceae bacterium]